MTVTASTKPRLPSHYSIWCDPPDTEGDEVLHIVSQQRRFKLKGHSFREFVRCVVPLLDGRHSIEEIYRQTAEVFAEADLVGAIQTLADNHLLEAGAAPLEGRDSLMPQINLLHELGASAQETVDRLQQARVVLVGLGGAGGALAYLLAMSGVGHIDCVDHSPVTPADVGFSPIYSPPDIGRTRSEVVAKKLAQSASGSTYRAITQSLETDEAVDEVIRDSALVVCALDTGMVNLAYKVNRACLRLRIRSIHCSLAGTEVVVGPLIIPFETACYLCYKMRRVACAANPEDAFAHERYLDRQRSDNNAARENLLPSGGLAAHLAGVEIIKELAGFGVSMVKGKLLIFEAFEGRFSRHVLLRKPWCPACFSIPADGKLEVKPASSNA